MPAKDWIWHASLAGDGALLATADRAGDARIWELETGKWVTLPFQHAHHVHRCALSPGGDRLATACCDALVRIYRIGTETRSVERLARIAESLSGHHSDPVLGLLPLSDSQHRRAWQETQADIPWPSASALEAWHRERARKAREMKTSFTAEFHERFLPDRETAPSPSPAIASGFPAPLFETATLSGPDLALSTVLAENQYVLLDFWASWCDPCRREFPTLRRLHEQFKGKGLQIVGVNLDTDGDKARTVIIEAQLDWPHAYDGQGGNGALAKLYHVRGIPQSVLIDRTGEIVAVGLRGEALEQQVASLLAGTSAHHVTLQGHTGMVYSVSLSPDGSRIASAGWDGLVKIWDLRTARQVLTLRGHADRVVDVVFSPDGKRVASASWDGSLRIWDAETGQLLATLRGHTSGVFTLMFSLDGRSIVSGSADFSIKLWDIEAGKSTVTMRGHRGGVESVAFSRDGSRVASGDVHGVIKIWNSTSGAEIATLAGHQRLVKEVAFSPDGQRIVSASDDAEIRIWDANSGMTLLRLRGHQAEVRGVAFSHDGQRVISCSYDKTIKVWDAVTGRELLTLRGHLNKVHSVAVSPDGTRVVSGSSDNSLRIWDLTTTAVPPFPASAAPVEPVLGDSPAPSEAADAGLSRTSWREFDDGFLVITDDGLMFIDRLGKSRPFAPPGATAAIQGEDVATRADRVIVYEANSAIEYDRIANRVRAVSFPAKCAGQAFCLLPTGGFATLDNRFDQVHILDSHGQLHATVAMADESDSQFQNLHAVVVDGSLIFSEDGFRRIGKIDLKDNSRSTLVDLRQQFGSWLGALTSANGHYYICQATTAYELQPNKPPVLFATLPEGNISGVAIDGHFAFFSLNFPGQVYRCSLETAKPQLFAEGLKRPRRIVGFHPKGD